MPLFAWELADRLAAADPAICVRDDLAEQGRLYLDPCSIQPDEVDLVAQAIRSHVEAAARSSVGRPMAWPGRRRRQIESLGMWPD